MAGLVRRRVTMIPCPGGETGEQASEIYRGTYPELPVPATHYVTSATALRSVDVVPSLPTRASNAAVVDRHNRKNGYVATSGKNQFNPGIPPMYESPYSSKFQPFLAGPLVNYILNACLYRAGYPAATVMNGGKRNMALSTRVDQLVTRDSGGPGPAQMTTSQRRFARVQRVPRYSTMPRSYPTQSAPG